MWLFDLLIGRRSLWRKVTDQRLANHQGDLLRIEAKLDEAHFLTNVTMGAFSEALDNANITVGALACDVAREKKHADVVSTAGELILSTIRVLRDRIEKLEQRADEADQQIAALCEWGRAMDDYVEDPTRHHNSYQRLIPLNVMRISARQDDPRGVTFE